MIVDIHTHIGLDNDGSFQTFENLIKNMDMNRIDYSVSFPLDEKNTDLVDASLSIANLGNPRIIPFLRFDPRKMTVERLEELLPKFRGVKLHTRAQNVDVMDKDYWPLFEKISASGKPLLIHTRSYQNPLTDPDHVSLLSEHFADMKIIIGHFGEGSLVTAERVKKFENLYLETSIQSLTNVRINLIYDIVGADKILFGSDVPYSDQEIELLKIRKSKMSEDEKDMVLYKNALRLLKMPDLKPVFS